MFSSLEITQEGFSEDDNDNFDDDEEDTVLDFTIFSAATKKEHKGQLIKNKAVSKAGPYRLYVDGVNVPEKLPREGSDSDEGAVSSGGKGSFVRRVESLSLYDDWRMWSRKTFEAFNSIIFF